MNARKQRRKQREVFEQRKRNKNAPTRESKQRFNKKSKTSASPIWHYWLPTIALPILAAIGEFVLIQYMSMVIYNIGKADNAKVGFFVHPGTIVTGIYLVSYLIIFPMLMWWCHRKFYATWYNNNAMFLTDDIEEYTNDAYIRTIDNITQELDAAPDVGLGFNGHASTLMSHMMLSNKGINKINMPQRDMSVDGYVKKNADGTIVKQMVPMFNPKLADLLFSMSQVPNEFRTLYDATEYDYNPKLKRNEGGGKDDKGHWKRSGAFGRKEYDKLSDYINHEFYPLDTDTERPAGVYFYDNRSVNTILIAITRAGKGQTYIEPAFDVWTREKKKWNIFTTDPKGELLAKFYYPATIRGFEIVQFNLMHPNLTNIYNPLANAIQAFRQNNPVKGTSLVDSIVDTLFPDNGEIWNPAAGNMFRRAVYLLFDYYIEQEAYIRYMGHKNGTPPEIISQAVNNNYSKVTLFNVYSLIGELAAKVSKDAKFINVDPSVPPVTEKDLLTLMFDAMAMLPMNDLRSKAITANNAIKQIAGAQQTIAGIYATLLTGLSVYADDTAIALMSGTLDESFDVAGLGFPRRFGVHFDSEYVKKFRITKELCRWTIYKDKDFTQKYEGTDFEHEERLGSSNWAWGYFAGMFDNDITYVKLTIEAEGGTVAKEFYFQFIKGYKKYDNISYVIDSITHKKIVSGGLLVELDPNTKQPTTSEFMTKEISLATQSYDNVTKPVFTASQVFYSEKPKFVFAITPPHLQVYQKHILVIIKQILDEQYSNSYVVKSNRKPIVGTRLMLEEFGNIRSGDKGIPNIDTVTSIALGQDVQITFVLQSFQQLKAVYDEDIEKIIRANSSNTIFLKSNDEDLVNGLVKLSGVKHEFRVKSKSVSRKLADVITVSEPVINYSGEQTETTALTSNDLLFLAGPAPGNGVTFSSGEMPIVNKRSTITPMAAGLHKHLPEPVGGKYSDANMPTTNTNDSVNFLDNLIDGESLVKARVEQAHIWQSDVKPRIEKIAEREHIVLNERDGSLSDMVMNTVYELYDKKAGQSHQSMMEPIVYWKVAQQMLDDVVAISDKNKPQKDRLSAVSRLRENLTRCVMDKNLDDLTTIYKDTLPTTKVNVGYDQIAVSKFVTTFHRKYPKPDNLSVDHQDVFKQASQIDGYHSEDPTKELLFDPLNNNHTSALEDIIGNALDNNHIPDGMDIDPIDTDTDDEQYKISVNGTYIMTYIKKDENNFNVIYTDDRNAMTKAITSNNQIIQLIQDWLNR